MDVDQFLFVVFRDVARRVLWPVAGADAWENREHCAKHFTPDLREAAINACASGDTHELDDTVSRLLWNLHADHGFDTARPAHWTEPKSLDEEVTAGRREQQIAAIAEAVGIFGYDPANIPVGGKARIWKHCTKEKPGLFTEHGFNHAWKASPFRVR